MTQDELQEVLRLHALWLSDSEKGKRADLSGADLSDAVLSRANLSHAGLRGADLSGADLSGAVLSHAGLRRADLRDADLRRADLRDADLSGAELRRADLSGADLRGADLRGADLKGAEFPAEEALRRQIVPQSGSFEAWKKLADGTLCHLRIPAEAARVGGVTGRKCRAAFVEVLSGEGYSWYDTGTFYKASELVGAGNWDPDPRIECSGGIHFFLTRLEAEEYQF